MTLLKKNIKFIPYLYFIAIISYWFTYINKTEGISAYPILLFGIPFLLQLIKPHKKLNFSLGIIFVCLSSYLVLAYLTAILNIIDWPKSIKATSFYGSIFIVGNLVMSLWIIRNSIRKVF